MYGRATPSCTGFRPVGGQSSPVETGETNLHALGMSRIVRLPLSFFNSHSYRL